MADFVATIPFPPDNLFSKFDLNFFGKFGKIEVLPKLG